MSVACLIVPWTGRVVWRERRQYDVLDAAYDHLGPTGFVSWAPDPHPAWSDAWAGSKPLMRTIDRERDGLLAWLDSTHHRLESLEPGAPMEDLAPLRAIVSDAEVIGIGEAVRGARSTHELRRFVHRVLRFVVEHMDVRTLVIEEQSLGAATVLDAYVGGGPGTSSHALGNAWTPWQAQEIREIVEWLRERNDRNPDDPLRISGAISEDELGLAGHVLECLERTDGRVVYWGGAAHAAVAPASDFTHPPKSPPGPSDGALLRRSLGTGYLSMGCICDHAIAGAPLPPPPSDFVETPLAHVGSPAWYLDLREPGNDAVRSWVDTPATTRLIGPQYDPQRDADFCMSGSPFRDWFDAILYVREITPARPLDETIRS